jgi:ABC-2 type transport system permease protein
MVEHPSVVRSIWLVARRELTASRSSFLAWALPLSGLVALVASIQPQAAGDGGVLAAKLALMPEAMKQAFNLAGAELSRPAGYLAANFITVTLGATVFAGLLGAGVMAREDTQRTSEALLTLPVARWHVLAGKSLALLVLLAGFHALVAAAGLLSLARVVSGELEAPLLVSMFGGAALLSVLFAAVGLALGTFLSKARAAPGLSLGLVLGTWLVGTAAKLSPQTRDAAQWSPFALVDPQAIVREGGLSAQALWLPALAAGLLIAAILWYERRDVHA